MRTIKTNIEDIIIGDRIQKNGGGYIEILEIKNDKYKVIPYICAGGWWYRVKRYCDVEPYWLTKEEIIAGINYDSPKTFYLDRYLEGRKDYFEDKIKIKCKEIIETKGDIKIKDLLSNYKLFKIFDSFGERKKYLIKNFTSFSIREINALTKANIVEIDQLLNICINDLKNIKGLGVESVQHILYELGVVDN